MRRHQASRCFEMGHERNAGVLCQCLCILWAQAQEDSLHTGCVHGVLALQVHQARTRPVPEGLGHEPSCVNRAARVGQKNIPALKGSGVGL